MKHSVKIPSAPGVPADEMVLAAAIASAKARGYGPCKGRLVKSENNKMFCCVIGALRLDEVDCIRLYDQTGVSTQQLLYGNDYTKFTTCSYDEGETTGHAFQLAMEDEPA